MSIDSKSFHDRMCIKYGDWPGFIYKPKDRKTNRLVQGLGINDIEFSKEPTINGKRMAHPLYVTWIHLLERCSDYYQLKRPTYKDVYVCEEFKSLSRFMQWAKDRYVKGYQLDKDIISRGNKEYSPNTCVFVPPEVNSFLTSRINVRGEFPIGVTKYRQKYVTQISKGGVKNHIGVYASIYEAHKGWQLEKIEYAKELMNKYSLPQLQLVINRLQHDYENGLITEVI